MSENAPVYSVAVPVDILRDQTISATAKLLYGIVDSFQRKSGICYASNERLAEELGGCTPRTVSKCIGELKDAGYVLIYSGKVRKISLSVYANDGQEGRRKLPPSEKKTSNGVEETFQVGGRNFPPSNIRDSNIIPPISPPEGGDAPKKKSRSSQYKAAPDILPQRFEKFWNFYRTYVPSDCSAGNRQKAIRAWDKLAPSDELVTTMATSLAAQVKSQTWLSGIGVPHASTWINNHGWEDDWGPAPTQKLQSNGYVDSEEAVEWAN